MNAYVWLVELAVWFASVFGAFMYGHHTGVDSQVAQDARLDKTIQQTREAAQQGAAAAIAAIKPRNVTIRQEVQHEIETHTVYRDCRVPADGVRLANDAITGGVHPAAAGQLPQAAADGH